MAAAEVVTFGGVAQPRAPFVEPAALFRLVQVQTYSTVITCMNSFYFGAGDTLQVPGSLLSDWNTNIVPTWKANVTDTMRFTQIYAQQMLPDLEAISAVTLTGTGTVSANPAPCVCCGVVTWRTPSLGRRSRGRSYIAGLPYSPPFTSNGYQWVGNAITNMNNIGNAILTRYTLGGNPFGFYLVVWSRKTYLDGPSPDAWPAAATMVNRFTSQSYICTMGTRRMGRGM